MEPLSSLQKVQKFPQPTLLSLGAIRSMKQTLHQLHAFEIAKKSLPNLRFVVAGDAQGAYGKKFLEEVEKSPYRNDIEYLGRVSSEKKKELMQKSHLIAVTSVKEGWGLIVTEANSQGTPAVAYDADGLRDSVRDGETGVLVKRNNPEALARAIVDLLGDADRYERLRRNGWKWSKTLTFEACYEDFVRLLRI
jgi:glycosyltransferase involved in cell wall biosynthesis